MACQSCHFSLVRREFRKKFFNVWRRRCVSEIATSSFETFYAERLEILIFLSFLFE